MIIKSNIEDFDFEAEGMEEYEPYCDVCGSEFNNIMELHLEGNCHGVGFRLCIDCRKTLVNILSETITMPCIQIELQQPKPGQTFVYDFQPAAI